jgi:hypothetical protein
MITAVVRFRLPEGTTRDDAKAMFEKSAPNYRGVPGISCHSRALGVPDTSHLL